MQTDLFSRRMSAEQGINITDAIGLSGTVRIDRYDATVFDMFGPIWDSATQKQKLAVARAYEPDSTQITHNIATEGQAMLIVDSLDRDQTGSGTASHLAVGTDNTTPTEYTDTSLGNEVYRTTVTNTGDYDDNLELTTFLGATEANSADMIREVGLFSSGTNGEGYMLNHSNVEPEPKSSKVALTITVTLEYRAV